MSHHLPDDDAKSDGHQVSDNENRTTQAQPDLSGMMDIPNHKYEGIPFGEMSAFELTALANRCAAIRRTVIRYQQDALHELN